MKNSASHAKEDVSPAAAGAIPPSPLSLAAAAPDGMATGGANVNGPFNLGALRPRSHHHAQQSPLHFLCRLQSPSILPLHSLQ